MPRTSKRQLNQKVKIELQDNFAYLISSLNNSNDIQNFFKDFLTDEERMMLSKRLMVHLMLDRGYETQDICSAVGVSKEMVRIHKTNNHIGGPVYKKIISKLVQRKEIKEFWKKVEKSLKPLEYMLTAKTNMKSRAKLFDYTSD